MRRGRWQVRDEILIDAPIERVFDVATNPQLVPKYADEIARIDVVEHISAREAVVRSVLKLGPLRMPCRYRYRYRRPRMYSGVQEGAKLMRGYFAFSLREEGSGTRVRHVEGIESGLPGLARLAGFVYFGLLRRGALEPELRRLAELVARSPHEAKAVAEEA